jgi:hypothetical protein
MLSLLQKYLPVLPIIAFAMMAVQLLLGWIFIRFIHYDSQYRTLPVESYQAELITAEDYAKLRDPSLEIVQLSNGRRITDRQPVFYERVLPNYKQVDGLYLHVTTVGTAHYYDRWIGDVLPLMMLTACGLFATWWDLRRRKDTGCGGNGG